MAREPHWTDGDGIGKKLTGHALAQRLDELADMARSNDREFFQTTRELRRLECRAIEFARAAGDALLEAKRRMGHRSKWSKWRYDELIKHGYMSRETTYAYMKVAREWSNPAIQKRLAAGEPIRSIREFNRILKQKSPIDYECPPRDEEKARQTIIRKQFGALLSRLSSNEWQVIADSEALEQLWDSFRAAMQTYIDEWIAEPEPQKTKWPRGIKPRGTGSDDGEL